MGEQTESDSIPGEPSLLHSRTPGLGGLYTRTAAVGRLANENYVCSTRLYERLSATGVEEIGAMIAEHPELRDIWAMKLEPGVRRGMTISFGIWLGHPAVTAATGLSAAQPPDEIHVMARGPLSAAGGLYEADIVANALAGIGVDIATLADGLDFGCSSGRVVRVLDAAYPNVRWRGCDPNLEAIAWASQTFPRIDFFASANTPPLYLPDDSLDLVLAISIWSHFAPGLALRWFDEMHRLIRPGGHLVFTTHGTTTVGYSGVRWIRPADQCDEIIAELYRRGWWYGAEFGEEGDWGVSDPEWGSSFFTPEWILTKLCPRWQIVEFASGRNQENQDVYVIERS